MQFKILINNFHDGRVSSIKRKLGCSATLKKNCVCDKRRPVRATFVPWQFPSKLLPPLYRRGDVNWLPQKTTITTRACFRNVKQVQPFFAARKGESNYLPGEYIFMKSFYNCKVVTWKSFLFGCECNLIHEIPWENTIVVLQVFDVL